MKFISKFLKTQISNIFHRRYTLESAVTAKIDVSEKPEKLKPFSAIPGPSKMMNYLDLVRFSSCVSELRHQWFEKYGEIVRFAL